MERAFRKGQDAIYLLCFLVTFLITCTGDLVLIPFLQGEGAALAFLAAIIVQTIQFSRGTQIAGVNRFWHSLLLCGSAALGSGLLARASHEGAGLQLVIAVCAYFLILFACRQIRPGDWITCKRVMYA